MHWQLGACSLVPQVGTAGPPVAAPEVPSRPARRGSQPPTVPSARLRPNAPQYSPRLRATAVLVVVVCLFAALFGRLWYFQGIEANSVAAKSVAGQGIETVYVPAPRGDIFDRDGVLLAGNKIEPVVTVAPPGRKPLTPGSWRLSALLGEPTSEVKAAINNVQYSPYQPVPVKVGVSNAVVLAIDENQSLLPGVTVQAEPVRYYPEGETTANIVGYISTITGPEYAQVKNEQCGRGVPCYQTTSLIGQARGGGQFRGLRPRHPRGGKSGKWTRRARCSGCSATGPPVPGRQPGPLHLAHGPASRGAGPERLGDKGAGDDRQRERPALPRPAASMVVEDPRNGQVLALATYPDYNPDDFLGGISEARWKYYNNPANNYPLIDRAISTGYAPGSTWKLITATAMLRYSLRSPYSYYDDTGTYTTGGQAFHDDDNVALAPGRPGPSHHRVERHILLQPGRPVLADP